MRLRESIGQLRFYLNEETLRSGGTVNTLRTSDYRIAATLVRAMIEYTRTTTQAAVSDVDFDPEMTIAARIVRFQETDTGDEKGTLLHLDENLPVHDAFLPEIEARTFALLQLREQQGTRATLIQLVRELQQESRVS